MRHQSGDVKSAHRVAVRRVCSAVALGLWLVHASTAHAGALFETSADRAAQDDLQRLAQAEGRYWTNHHAYTGVFADLGPPTFEATKGIYLQVETATPSQFRAIAMPRESHSARVFALEANGGKATVKELDDNEVSTYVFGALKMIRSTQRMKLSLAAFSSAGLLGLLIYGARLHRKGAAGQWRASAPYFLGLIPLYVTLILSTFVDEHTYIGPLVLVMAVAGVLGGLSSIIIGVVTLWQSITQERDFHFRRLALVGILFAVLGLVSPFYTFYPHLPWIGELTTRPSAHHILPP
ncbi:MAG TPA: type IV pilin protein [Nitrospiria bacterium]|nr:type IV pilin protein [Nitrospiria bacterium]